MSSQRWYIQALTCHSSETSPSFVLHLENQKFLFNCGENTTRAFIQQRSQVKKVSNIFLSNLHQDYAGGLHGTLLNLHESGARKIHIHGPGLTDYFIATGRYHVRRERFHVACHPIPDTVSRLAHKDDSMSIYAFPLVPAKSKSTGGSDTHVHKRRKVETEFDATVKQRIADIHQDMFRPDGKAPSQGEQDVNGKRRQTPAWDHESLPPPPVNPSHQANLVWLGIGPAIRGRFLADQAKKLGVRPGKDFGQLAQGQSVAATDGTIVEPSQCMTPGEPSTAFLVVHCTDKEQMHQLVDTHATEIQRLLKEAESRLVVIFHVVKVAILQDAAYQAWMQSFGDSVQHVICNRAVTPNYITFAYSTLLQMRLSRLDQDIFAKPVYSLEPKVQLSDIDGLPSNCKVLDADFRISGSARTLAQHSSQRRQLYCDLDSPEALEQEATLKVLSDEAPQEAKERAQQVWQSYLDHVSEAKQHVSHIKAPAPICGDQLVITTLGTGSATPAKYRTVSSNLVQDPSSGLAFLLDTGEGTFGQIARRFGASKALDILRDLSFIFISHMHADHHAGLASLLAKRATTHPTRTLYLISPRSVWTYIKELDVIEDLALSTVQFVNVEICAPSWTGSLEAVQSIEPLLKAYDLASIKTVVVQHRARCFGCIVTSNTGWKLSFSGDTRPCDALVEAGKDSTVLFVFLYTFAADMTQLIRHCRIHEATMDNGLTEQAITKGHSTFEEALDVAKRMNAKRCILTHFSQRYPKLPTIPEEALGKIPTALAFDLMQIQVGHVWKAVHYLPAMNQLFQDIELPTRQPTPL